MTLIDDVKKRLDENATRIEVPQGAGADAVMQRATHRARSVKLLSAAATVVLFGLLVVGVGTALREPDDSVFASQTDDPGFADEDLVPTHVVFDGGRFVGLANDDAPVGAPLDESVFVVATSVNGEDWQRVEGSPLFTSRWPLLVEHEGTYFVVSSAADGLVISTTADLITWDERRDQLPVDLVEDGYFLSFGAAVAAEAGVLITGMNWPEPLPIEDELIELGYDPDELCDLSWTASEATFRVCGTAERLRESVTTSVRTGPPSEPIVLFAALGEDVVEVTFPSNDNRSPSPTRGFVYDTPTGFGYAGTGTYESDDGTTWTEIDADGLAPMMAVRGQERVYRSDFGIPDMAFRSGSDPWQPIDLLPLYEDQPDRPRWFTGLQAGQAGWTLVAQRSFMTRQEVEGVERSRSGSSEFTVTNPDGYVLAGTAPFGPATLQDPSGVIVQTWDQLEVKNPIWSGFEVDRSGVHLELTNNADTVVSFTTQQWESLIDPLNQLEYDLLFSADGQNWEILETYAELPVVLAQGDDELVVRVYSALHYSRISTDVNVVGVEPAD